MTLVFKSFQSIWQITSCLVAYKYQNDMKYLIIQIHAAKSLRSELWRIVKRRVVMSWARFTILQDVPWKCVIGVENFSVDVPNSRLLESGPAACQISNQNWIFQRSTTRVGNFASSYENTSHWVLKLTTGNCWLQKFEHRTYLRYKL